MLQSVEDEITTKRLIVHPGFVFRAFRRHVGGARTGPDLHIEIAGTVRDANLNTPVAAAVLDSYDI